MAQPLVRWRWAWPSYPVCRLLACWLIVSALRHAQLLEGSLTEGLRWYGALSRGPISELPSRHHGLVQASELNDLDVRHRRAAAKLASGLRVACPPAVGYA